MLCNIELYCIHNDSSSGNLWCPHTPYASMTPSYSFLKSGVRPENASRCTPNTGFIDYKTGKLLWSVSDHRGIPAMLKE